MDDFLSQLDSDVVSTQSRRHPAWPWSIAASLVAAAIMVWMISDSRQSGDSLEFEAVTDGQIAALSYVYTLDIESANRVAAERAIVDRVPGASLSQAGDQYRLVVRMPSKTVSELTEIARILENIDGVERAALVGVQLPVE